MTAIHSFPYTESSPAWDYDDLSPQCPYVNYPPYTATYLRDLLAHLVSVSAGNPASLLTSLSEPGLYALAAALRSVAGYDPLRNDDNLRDSLIAELRWRNCKAMGTDPQGPVRRGRLVQLVASCTLLSVAGASSLQRQKLSGECPFCSAPDFRVFLPTVHWRCFACDRQGSLLEFAESLLETV
ncbi:MAG: hypothetical protein F4X64_02365 [Chloroflexi bacterium]|nr:hypothetical protein [Chloroflexota bacterium]